MWIVKPEEGVAGDPQFGDDFILKELLAEIWRADRRTQNIEATIPFEGVTKLRPHVETFLNGVAQSRRTGDEVALIAVEENAI